MNAVILSLGGNLGDRKAILKAAVAELTAAVGEIRLFSSIYECEAWGYESSGNFYNMVIEIVTDLTAEEVLTTSLAIESNLGRTRSAKGYADRTCDIDMIFYNQRIVKDKTLILPHPRYHLRKFVLFPLLEIKPNGYDFEKQKSFKTLLEECPDTSGIQKIGGLY